MNYRQVHLDFHTSEKYHVFSLRLIVNKKKKRC